MGMHRLAIAATAWLLVPPGGHSLRPGAEEFEGVMHKTWKARSAIANENLAMDEPVAAAPPVQVPAVFYMFALISCLLVCVPAVFYATRSKEAEEGDAEGESTWWGSAVRALPRVCGLCACVGLTLIVTVLVPTGICAAREPAYASVLVPEGGNPVFVLDNMSALPPQSLYPMLREGLEGEQWTHEASGYTYARVGVHEAPMLLYKGTKIDGVWERVPVPVRGVFWMHGNGLPEVLATLQNGEWFEQEQILVFPNFPFSWTWWGGSSPPAGISDVRNVYEFLDAKNLAESMGEGNNSMALSFRHCPKGFVCEEGSADKFAFADMKSHAGGDLTGMSTMYRFASWTMELDESTAPRYSRWYRRTAIVCNQIEFGSYWLTKIIDENGERIEPHYSQYVEFMEGQEQILWTGFGAGNHLV